MRQPGFTFEEDRARLGELEDKRRSELYDALHNKKSKSVQRKAAEAWWVCVADLFELYKDESLRGGSVQHMPLGFLSTMEGMARILAQGRLPTPLTFASRREFSIARERDIAAAVGYIQAAKAGRIDDKSPANTVGAAFGVSRELAGEWYRQRRRYLSVFNPSNDPDKIVEQMVTAGQQFRWNAEQGQAAED